MTCEKAVLSPPTEIYRVSSTSQCRFEFGHLTPRLPLSSIFAFGCLCFPPEFTPGDSSRFFKIRYDWAGISLEYIPDPLSNCFGLTLTKDVDTKFNMYATADNSDEKVVDTSREPVTTGRFCTKWVNVWLG